MMLSGAELGKDEAIKKHNLESKFRVLPKQFGEYNKEKIFEVEEICVGTNTMSFQSYLKCRNYNFILQLLSHGVFRPVYKLTQKIGISWFNFSKELADAVQNENFKGKLKDLYNDFCKESHSELFDSKEEVIKFYTEQKNYNLLLKGEIGGNLLAKYTAKGLLIYDDILTSIFYVMRNKLDKIYKEKFSLILNSSEKWLKSIHMMREIYGNKKEIKENIRHKLDIDFDFPSWLSKSHLPFDQFKKRSTYELDYDLKRISHLRGEIKSIYGNDKERALDRHLIQYLLSGSNILEKRFEKIN